MSFARLLLTAVGLTLTNPLASAAINGDIARPPQFVVLAFDGSKSVQMWQETQSYADQMTKSGKHLRFTYFINSAYFLNRAMKDKYDAPEAGPGKSAIGFGGTAADVMARYDQTNLAFKDGHEIANHAAGHFDGTKWTEMDWRNEFNQFYDMIFDLFRFNETKPTRLFPTGWAFNTKDIIGFRAPQLGQNQALYRVLPDYGIKYDTSKTADPSYWPEKNADGLWNFPLSLIPVSGTARKTLSMDYNFYYVQSQAKEDPANAKAYEEQMYRSYIAYFQGNYNSNRAPVNIGHHFSKWNAGAYWNAERRFANQVCGLPEVKCVTYRELMAYMDSLTSRELASYQHGAFKKSAPVRLIADNKTYDLRISLAQSDDGKLNFAFDGAHSAMLNGPRGSGIRVEYAINGVKVPKEHIAIEHIRNRTAVGETATVRARVIKNGTEIQSGTYKIYNVGTASEQLSSHQEEERDLISDPPEAHDEDLH